LSVSGIASIPSACHSIVAIFHPPSRSDKVRSDGIVLLIQPQRFSAWAGVAILAAAASAAMMAISFTNDFLLKNFVYVEAHFAKYGRILKLEVQPLRLG
jgi:hypothetical protein